MFYLQNRGDARAMEPMKSAGRYRNVSKSLLTQAIDFLPDPTFAIDLMGRVLLWNRAMETLTQIKAEDIVGKGDHEYSLPFYGERRPILIDMVLQDNAGIEEKYNYIWRERDSLYAETMVLHTKKSLWGKASPIYGDDGCRIIGAIESIRDITDSKRSEEALRQREERYRGILEDMEEAYYEVDLKGRFTFSNSAMTRTYGYTEDDFIGTSYKVAMDKENIEKVFNAFHQVYVTGETIKGVDWKLRNKEGKEVHVEASVSLRRDSQGNPIGFKGVTRDISERMKAEEALKKSEELYTRLVNTIPDFIIRTDLDGRILFMNDHALQISGYSREELEGQNMLMFIAPEDQGKAVEYTMLMMESSLGPQEYHLIMKDCRRIPFEVNGDVLRKEDGKPFGLVLVCRDITERKRMEEELRESEKKFERTFRMGPDVMAISRISDGAYVDVNDEFFRQMGFTREETIGRTSSELGIWVDTSDRDRMEKRLRTEGEIQGEQYRFRSKDGIIKTGEMSTRIITIGGERCILTMARDISEKIKTQKVLRESEEKFRSVVERSLVGIAIIDNALRYIYVNEEFCRVAGYPEQEMIGRIFTFPLSDECVQLVTDRFKRRQLGEDVPSQYEFSFLQKNGSTHIGEVRSAVYTDSSGNLRTIIQVIDITDRKRADEEKQRLEARLNRAEKMEALGTLAGGVAHDLNNVLGVVTGYAELLLKGMKENDPIRPHLSNIMKGGERAAAIVFDLLTLARRGVPVREVFDVNKVVEDFKTSPELERLSSYHALVRFQIDLDPDLLNISGSPVNLGKSLFNLVSNAVEAMPGGGLLTIRTANQYLDKPLQGYDEVREGDYVVLTVSDEGNGISAEDLNHIFEPFYTKKVMGRSGTGLGLAVVWGTVKDHNGYINVQSEEGKGSTFTLYFPVTRQEPSIAAASVSMSEYMGREEFILIVDDVKEQRDLAAEMLRGINYRVEVVKSGEEAVAYLRDHKVDLMILDMIMDPGMDGLDTYRRVLKIHPKQKAIIVSGFSDTNRVKKTQALGAGDYVRKPYIIEKLGMAVRKELDRST